MDCAKYQQILASQYIPNYKRGQIFQQDGALCHTSGSTRGRRSRSFRDDQHSLRIWILLSISGEEWRRTLGGSSRRTLRSFGMPARWPSMPSPTTSASSTTLCQTGWQLFCRPKEPIQDINFLTFTPWWNTRLISSFILFTFWEG